MRPGTVDLSEIRYVPPRVFPAIRNYRLFTGDIFMSVAGTLGVVGKIPDELDGANLTENADRITGIDCDQDYLLYTLMSPLIQAEIESIRTVGAQPKLALTRIREFRIPLPPTTTEQEAIGSALSDVDALIEALQQLIAKKRRIKQGAMQELLTGKRRLPGFGTVSGYKQTEVGLIPVDWAYRRLTDVAALESGHTPSRRQSVYWDGDIPWVSLHDSASLDVPVLMSTAQTMGPLGLANSSARLLPVGTVVISRTATIGKVAVLGREMATSQDFANYVCGPTVYNMYLLHLFRSMGRRWKQLMAGSTHKTVYMPVFERLRVPLPPSRAEQEAIASTLSEFDTELNALEAKLAKARQLKQGMMHELLTGRIRLV